MVEWPLEIKMCLIMNNSHEREHLLLSPSTICCLFEPWLKLILFSRSKMVSYIMLLFNLCCVRIWVMYVGVLPT